MPDDDERALLDTVADAARTAGLAVPAWDPALAQVARDLARLLPEQDTPPADLVSGLMGYHGLVEPSPHLIVATGGGSLAEIADQIRDKAAEILRARTFSTVAAAATTAGGARRVVVAFGERFIELDPMPRRVPSDGRARLHGRLLPPYGAPVAYRTPPDGAAEPLTLTGKGADVAGESRCDRGRGAYQIEVLGEAGAGPVVLANFTVWCGAEPPSQLAYATDPPPESELAVERAILASINTERAARRLPDLAPDARLRAVARAHSYDMRERGYVAHVSPSGDGPAQRVRRAGMVAEILHENIARAYSAAEAHRGLMASPGHRVPILHPDTTHLGVGIVFGAEAAPGRPEIYVTELFARFLPADRAALLARLRESMAARRREHRLAPMRDDDELDAVAHEAAQAWAGGGPTQLGPRAGTLIRRFDRVGTTFLTASTTDLPADDPLLVSPDFTHLGLGVAVGRHPEMGRDALWVVILVAAKR